MNFQIFGSEKAPTLLLIPGLGVSYEIFLPLIRLVEERFRIMAVGWQTGRLRWLQVRLYQ